MPIPTLLTISDEVVSFYHWAKGYYTHDGLQVKTWKSVIKSDSRREPATATIEDTVMQGTNLVVQVGSVLSLPYLYLSGFTDPISMVAPLFGATYLYHRSFNAEEARKRH